VVKEDNRPLFERYAKSLAEAGEKSDAPATLLLRCTTWRAGNLDELIAAVGTIKACEQVPEGEACAWAIARCKKEHAGLLTREAATALVERVGSSLGRLDSELGKLAAAAGEAGGKPLPITPELVAQFVGQSRETEAWGIQREMLDANAERCLKGVRGALDVSRHPSALIFYSLTDLARKVHACGVASRAGANFFQLKGPLRLWGDGGEAIFSAGKHSEPASARRLLRECVEMIVRSRTSLGDDERALERLAISFAMFNQRRRKA
jgi:DNA polymerase III delta subunit